jgi:hypothetical protein
MKTIEIENAYLYIFKLGKMKKYSHDIKILKAYLPSIPKFWDGKTSVLELKEADYNWRQMEWWAFYFEYQVKKTLPNVFILLK